MTYTYVNEDQIDEELKCSICNEPFQSPMNCEACGNTYCQTCITSWLDKHSTCPLCRQPGRRHVPVINRVVLNQLNRLLVQCTLCQQSNIQRSNFTDHVTCTCPRQIVPCTLICGWSGPREELSSHVISCRRQQALAGQVRSYLVQFLIVLLAIVLFVVWKSS